MSSSPMAGLVAVVTGGAGHLGAAMTASMAECGAAVVVADLDADRAAAHAQMLTRDGFDALPIQLDVASEESVNSGFDLVVARYGGVDVLVNNAAPSSRIAEDNPVLDVALDTWDTIVNVILRGALLCVRRAVPLMTARGGGSIVNISSIHAHGGSRDLSAYPVAKSALLGLTRVVATQYGRSGVRCNSVTLGTIPYPFRSAPARQKRLRHQLLAREGVPADAASLVAFLASPQSGFLTGAEFVADGGVLAHLPSYGDSAAGLPRAEAGEIDQPLAPEDHPAHLGLAFREFGPFA